MKKEFIGTLKAEWFITTQKRTPGFIQIEVHAGDRKALVDQIVDLSQLEGFQIFCIDRDAIEICSGNKDIDIEMKGTQGNGSDGLSIQLADALRRISKQKGIFLIEFGEYDQSNPGLIATRLKRLEGEKLLCFITKPGTKITVPYLEEKIRCIHFGPPDGFEIAEIARNLDIKKAPRFPEIVRLCLGLDRETVSDLLLRILTFEELEGFSQIARAIHRYKAEYILKNSDVLDYSFCDENPHIFGYDNLISWIKLRYRIIIKGESKRAILIYGIPGTGKTSAASQIAYELRLPLIRFHFSALREKLQGEAEKKFRYALKLVERMAPCVMLGDEYDKTLSSMAANESADGGVGSALLSIWLNWIEKPVPVIFIGTSNSLSIRPEELRRFEPFFVDVPQKETAKAILWSTLIKNDIRMAYEEVAEIAEEMAGIFSGDLIKKTVDTAIATATSSQKQPKVKDLKLGYEKYLDRAISLHLSTLQIRDQANLHGLKTTGM